MVFQVPETMPNNIFSIDPDCPDSDLISKAANIISGGGVVVFPTQSLYGLGANALDEDAVNRVFHIKKRPPDKPVLVLINNISSMDTIVREVPSAAKRIMSACWPGGVTLVFHARPGLPRNLTAGSGKIGVRLPLHPVARSIVEAFKGPVTGTSANLSGQAGSREISEISPQVLEEVRMALDAGTLIGGMGSTVVDVTKSKPAILREGLVPASRILETILGS